MTALTPDQAFEAYEAVRHRLPPAVTPARPPEKVASLADLADRFDVFLLDAFGVLNIGETAIAGTAERVEDLRRAGKRVMVVSNAASVPAGALVRKYARLGYDFDAADIVTSRTTMAAAMGARGAMVWGVMAPDPDDLGDVAGPDARLLGDTPADYADVDGFLLVGSGGWTDYRQLLLEAALSARPRPVLVANPDIVAPREGGFSVEPGHFAHRAADLTGIAPEFFGKPFANIYDLVFERLGQVDRDRVLMVGDSLHTDILGAQTAGVRSALVSQFGFFATSDVSQAIARSGIFPDFVIDRP